MEPVGILLLCFAGILTIRQIIQKYQEKKLIEAKSEVTLRLEAQRFEKIKEILTDGVIEGSPKALEALGPLVEIMAEQMKGPEIIERMKLEHKHRIEEIEAKNEPYRLYAEQIERAQETYASTFDKSSDLKRVLDGLKEANQPFLPALDAVPAEALFDLKAKK